MSRLEEKDQEMKAEYNKLHSRYTELFKTHVDYMERAKILAGADRMEQMGTLTLFLTIFLLCVRKFVFFAGDKAVLESRGTSTSRWVFGLSAALRSDSHPLSSKAQE